jgi:hypothetical protein
MSSSNLVQCPQCTHEFPLTDALLARINREAQAGIEARVKAEREKMEREAADKIQAATDRMAAEKRQADAHAAKLRDEAVAAALKLEQDRQANETKLQADREAAKQKSIDDLMAKLTAAQKQNEELAAKERVVAIEARQKANEEAQKRFDDQAKALEQKLQQDAELKSKGLEVQLKSLRDQLEEANRRANQGSMQNQGAALEASFEEQLRRAFPGDGISDIPTGTKGADVILDVRSATGAAAGRIIFETKRTKGWSEDWIGKLREDMHREGAAIGVIVSQALPRDIKSCGQKGNVWICDYASVMALVQSLRWGLTEVSVQRLARETSGEASALLYDFVTGMDFRNRVLTMMQIYTNMRKTLAKERTAMEKLWSIRESQLNLLAGHTSHVVSTIETTTGRRLERDGLAMLQDAIDDFQADFADIEVDVQPALTAQPVTEEQKQHFLSTLEAASGKSSNTSLRAALGWNESLYESVKVTLIADGSIASGKGRGGSVKLLPK